MARAEGPRSKVMERLRSLRSAACLRSVSPGLAAGLAASLFEVPHLIAAGIQAHAPAMQLAVAILATVVAACTLGLAFGLTFELVFRFMLGSEIMLSFADTSHEARIQRRQIAAQVVAGFFSTVGLVYTISVIQANTAHIFADKYASLSVQVVPATIFWLLLHFRLCAGLLWLLKRTDRLRQIATVGGVVVFLFSYLIAGRLFGGSPEIGRALLSLEAAFLAFAIAWAWRSRWFYALSPAFAGAALLVAVFLTISGLSYPVRAILYRSHGPAENLVLRFLTRNFPDHISQLRMAIDRGTSLIEQGVAPDLASSDRVRATHGPNAPTSRPDIILITVDSLRADRLGCCGSRAVATPNMDMLAAQSRTFLNAFSTAPTTIASLEQTMVGRLLHELPASHLASNRVTVVSPEANSIASTLADSGYRTAAFLGYPLTSFSEFIGHGFQVLQVLAPKGGGSTARDILGRILAQLESAKERPEFLWGHVMDIHDWQKEGVKQRYSGPEPYDKRVAFIDTELGAFLTRLFTLERGRNSIVILSADHGESLGEQGLFFHGFMMAPRTLRVPLIIRFPSDQPRRITTGVSLIDLGPTILAAAGLSRGEFPGQDLRELEDNGPPGEWPTGKPAFHETAVRTTITAYTVGVTAFPWQLWYLPRYDILSLHNLANDPDGEENLAGQGLLQERILVQFLIDRFSQSQAYVSH